MQITNMSGFSGCKVLLYDDENLLFVRKISGSIEYNNRLQLQMEKQKNFKSAFVGVPAIIDSGFDNGLFYFDMEFLQGITLAEKLKTMRVGDIHKYVEILGEFLFEQGGNNSEMAVESFGRKIDQLSNDLKNKNETVCEALGLLKKHDWKMLPCGTCHGDLTLENIIIHDGNLYLIDFLDSFFDSWVLDVATMLQDARCLWSFRNNDKVNNNTLVRMMIFNDLLLDFIKNKQPDKMIDIYFALLLKLVRILPYCNDDKTELFLNEKIGMVMKMIEKEDQL
ncbi:phosphotransferase [Butyrivibrio sp. INlla16]|uniref:phosphotransferase n=1 Tax=Butyrivibrio sp. INlla16 TaxID=1520807 RepID=UPI0008818654|nr:phosphotransferase [Butyrivibrio sp. INlla16]SDB67333.1 Phosphotransferase enzyme family protein [Butyrivibrio sp. INlla16]